MFDVFLVLLGALVAAAAFLSVSHWRRTRSVSSDRHPESDNFVMVLADKEEDRAEQVAALEAAEPEVLALSTERHNEFYFLGPTKDIDEYGSVLAEAPSQLARHATHLRAGADAVRSFAEVSGRLVLVDEKTAAAIRSGMMMRDKAGQMVAVAKGADGKIASLARFRQVGGLAAGAASVTNALSAMATQAQLDRIEKQLAAISKSVDAVGQEQLRQWHANTRGAQDMLREVYSTARRSGELTRSNWSQIAGMGQVVRRQIHGDRDRLVREIDKLEQIAGAKSLRTRERDLEDAVDAVRRAQAALTDSSRGWVQYAGLRLWRFAIEDDPTTSAYREELEAFIRESGEDVMALRERVSRAIEAVGESRWRGRARHPLAARRLPAKVMRSIDAIKKVNWQPLALQTPSKELAIRR